MLTGHDMAFMLLGAGVASNLTRAELQRIDVDIPNAFAKAARASGVPHMSIMTAVNANSSTPDSGESTYGGSGTYNQIKGRLEDAMAAFDFPTLRVFRPAGILGTPNTPGWLVALAPWVQKFLPGRYRFTSVEDIAKGMFAEARRVVAATPGKAAAHRVLHVPDYTSEAGIQV